MSRVSAELLSAPSSRPEIATAPSDKAEPCAVLVNLKKKGCQHQSAAGNRGGSEGASSSPADAAAGFLSQEVQLPSPFLLRLFERARRERKPNSESTHEPAHHTHRA